jgi:3-hydroxyisobutyrate dehydrogenase
MTLSGSLAIGFLELGVAGFSIAGLLAGKGHRVTVFDSTEAKAVEWAQKYGGIAAGTPADAARNVDVLVACASNEHALHRLLMESHGALSVIREGALLIDHSMISTQAAETISALCRQVKVDYVDAPYFGGQREAREGRLTVMVGGDKAAYDRARPVIAAYARYIQLMGSVGAGLRTKLVGQIAMAGMLKGLSDSLEAIERERLHPKLAMDVLSHALADQVPELANLILFENEVIKSLNVT